MSGYHRQWMALSINDLIPVKPFPDANRAGYYLASVEIQIRPPKKSDPIEISADDLQKHLLNTYKELLFTFKETFLFEYQGVPYTGKVTGLCLADPGVLQDEATRLRNNCGVMMQTTNMTFTEVEGVRLKYGNKRYPSSSPGLVLL
jgi:hypothetical protein